MKILIYDLIHNCFTVNRVYEYYQYLVGICSITSYIYLGKYMEEYDPLRWKIGNVLGKVSWKDILVNL